MSPIPSLAMHCTNINSIYGLPPNFKWKKIIKKKKAKKVKKMKKDNTNKKKENETEFVEWMREHRKEIQIRLSSDCENVTSIDVVNEARRVWKELNNPNV